MAGALEFWDDPIIPSPTGVQAPAVFFAQGEGPTYLANPWETIFLDGTPVPGRCKVHGLPQLKIDVKPKAGRDTATITATGYLPGPIEIELLLWTADQWDTFVALVPQIWRKPNKKTKIGELAIAIGHPGCDLWGVSQVVVQGVSIPEPGEVPQSMAIKIKCVEFVGPSKDIATKTAKPAPAFPAIDPRHPAINVAKAPSNDVPHL